MLWNRMRGLDADARRSLGGRRASRKQREASPHEWKGRAEARGVGEDLSVEAHTTRRQSRGSRCQGEAGKGGKLRPHQRSQFRE